MSEQQTAGARNVTETAVLAGQPASFWVASLASLAMIVGAVAPWATAFGFMTLSGTRMHGWNEVALGIWGLAMLGAHLLRRTRLALVGAALAGAFGAVQAILTLAKLGSSGAVTVFGVEYRYLDPAWGIYVVLAGAIGLVCSAALTWLAARSAE